MPGAWAYVRFVEDNECFIVKQRDIKNFNRNDLTKKYQVMYLDGYHYSACVLLLGSSEKELQERIEKGPRLKYPPAHLMQSAAEGEEDEEEEGREFKDQQNITSEKNGLQLAAKDKPKRKKTVTKSNPPETKFCFNEILDEIRATEQLEPSDEDNKDKLLIQHLQEENKKLKKLNLLLQQRVIDDWNVMSPKLSLIIDNKHDEVQNKEIPSERPVVPVTLEVGGRNGGKIHLGRSVFLDETIFDAICFKSKTNAVFIKNVASVVFGEHILMNSSVTGAKCNRLKTATKDVKPALDVTKVMAIKDIFRFKLKNDNLAQKDIDEELKKVNIYLAQKIADLRRLQKHHAEDKIQEKSNEETQEDEAGEAHQEQEEVLSLSGEIEKARLILDT